VECGSVVVFDRSLAHTHTQSTAADERAKETLTCLMDPTLHKKDMCHVQAAYPGQGHGGKEGGENTWERVSESVNVRC
jgi:hypothetical protein